MANAFEMVARCALRQSDQAGWNCQTCGSPRHPIFYGCSTCNLQIQAGVRRETALPPLTRYAR